MQERLTVSRPYAQAAFDIARRQNALDAWSEAFSVFAVALKVPEMRALVKNPKVTGDQLIEIIGAITPGGLGSELRNFVRHLIDVERVEYLPEIAELFHQHCAEAQGFVDVQVTSAYPLEEAEQRAIAEGLKARLTHTIELHCKTDPNLIGGAVIRINDTVIDLSVRGRLRSLENQLI
jgi:F-type H+-transporting ATPase subunit delta